MIEKKLQIQGLSEASKQIISDLEDFHKDLVKVFTKDKSLAKSGLLGNDPLQRLRGFKTVNGKSGLRSPEKKILKYEALLICIRFPSDFTIMILKSRVAI